MIFGINVGYPLGNTYSLSIDYFGKIANPQNIFFDALDLSLGLN